MRLRLRAVVWAAGWPARTALLACVYAYRWTLGQVVGGSCRFYPSCSAYAIGAIRNAGALRGAALTAWRVLRCSPLTKGGVDHPPGPRSRSLLYDAVVQRRTAGPIHRHRRAA